MTKISPCPFCGAEAERYDDQDTGSPNYGASWIECTRCHACSALHGDRKENLISGWNDRCAALQDARVDIYRSALLDIKCAHVPDQPAHSQADETTWVMQHVGAIRRVASKAIDEALALRSAGEPKCCKGLAPVSECQCEKDRLTALDERPVAWRRRRRGSSDSAGWTMCPEYPGKDPEFDLQSLFLHPASLTPTEGAK